MATSTLIEHWFEQLRETEELIEHGSPQLRWLRVAYARIYRFLLSTYGAEPVDRDAESAGDDTLPEKFSRLTIEPSVDFRGKPARTGAQILPTLKSLSAAQDGVESGPLQLGLHGTDWIMVATLPLEHAGEVENRLGRANVNTRLTRKGNQIVVEVPFRLREAARECLLDVDPPSPPEPDSPPRERRELPARPGSTARLANFLRSDGGRSEERPQTADRVITRTFIAGGIFLLLLLLGLAACTSWVGAVVFGTALLALFAALVYWANAFPRR